MKQNFERVYMQTLRHLYDTETQITMSLTPVYESGLDREFLAAVRAIEGQSKAQVERLEEVFRILYQKPRGEASWVATALLREAWEASSLNDGCTERCAAALLALKRYELTLYEGLLHWTERCDLYEVLPALRRSLAEELFQTSVLAGFAFDKSDDPPLLHNAETCLVH